MVASTMDTLLAELERVLRDDDRDANGVAKKRIADTTVFQCLRDLRGILDETVRGDRDSLQDTFGAPCLRLSRFRTVLDACVWRVLFNADNLTPDQRLLVSCSQACSTIEEILYELGLSAVLSEAYAKEHAAFAARRIVGADSLKRKSSRSIVPASAVDECRNEDSSTPGAERAGESRDGSNRVNGNETANVATQDATLSSPNSLPDVKDASVAPRSHGLLQPQLGENTSYAFDNGCYDFSAPLTAEIVRKVGVTGHWGGTSVASSYYSASRNGSRAPSVSSMRTLDDMCKRPSFYDEARRSRRGRSVPPVREATRIHE